MDTFMITVVILSIFSKAVLSEADLQNFNSNQDNLNPINDEDTDTTKKEQGKRTIFNPTIERYAWAKHVGIKPSGHKYVIGYSPVDLKYRPVIRPIAIKHQGYHYNRPKIQFHIKKPVIHIPQVRPVVHTGWKPSPQVKPFVPIHVPPPVHVVHKPSEPVHVDHLHLKPVPHLDHVENVPAAHVDHIHTLPHEHKVQAVHVDHVHQVPAQHVDHVHLAPIQQVSHVHPAPIQHFGHEHSVPVHHVDHIHSVPAHVHHLQSAPVQHFDHVHAVPVQHFDHVHQVQHLHPVPAVQTPFIPSAQLYEVTKPDLGVLPFGAVFQSPVLKDVPPPQFKPALIPQPFVPVQHLHPVQAATPIHSVASVQPIASVRPAPAIHAQPVQPITPVRPVQPVHPAVTQIEYHGTNFINLPSGQLQGVQQVPVNGVHSLLPQHYHLHYPQIPQEQHEIRAPSVSSTAGVFPNQQQLPLDTQPHFQAAGQNVFQQHLPQSQSHFQTDQDQGQVQYLNNQGHFQQELPQNNFHQVSSQSNRQPEINVQVIQPEDYEDQVNSQPDHQEGRFQQANEVSSQQFFRQGQFRIGDQGDNQGYFYQQPQDGAQESGQGRAIQPGQTDLQLPLHLPQHPGFQSNRQYYQDNYQDASQLNEKVFKLSIQLEPPYKK